MLINLVPDFLAVIDAADPGSAYDAYFAAHERILRAYWHNYVIEPEGTAFRDVVRATATAPRDDLRAMLETTDIVGIAHRTERQCRDLLASDVDVDVVLMVGVGAANAGELVVGGRGIAFVCLEHFTGVINPQTHGLGLDPELIPLWLAHEMAHAVRYTSPGSRSELRQLVADAGGWYSYWDTGQRASLRELLVNEGVAVHTSRMICPGSAAWEYFGYERREFARVRESEAAVARAASGDLDHAGLGLRLRFLSGGMSDAARRVAGTTIPERAGYYLGARMVESAVAHRGLAWTVRAAAQEIVDVASAEAQIA